MKTNSLHKILLAFAFVFCSQMSNGQTYTATFTQGQPPAAANITAWVAFCASLNANSYCRMEFFSNLDPGRTCNDPATCLAIANGLRLGTNVTATFGGITWRTGNCGGTELTADGSSCSCTNNGYSIRANGNVGSSWGAINQYTCGAVTQTFTVRFSTTPPVLTNIITTDTLVCAGGFGSYQVAPDPSNPVFNWTVPVGWTILSGLGTDSIYVQYANNSGTVSVNATAAWLDDWKINTMTPQFSALNEKYKIAKEINPVYMVEDNPSEVKILLEHGVNCFLRKAWYNKSYWEELPTIDNLYDIDL